MFNKMRNNCKVVLIFPIIYVFINSGFSQKQCTTPNNESGVCVPFINCQAFTNVWLQRRSENIRFFRASYCGFNGTAPLVCCGTYSRFLSDVKLVTLSATGVSLPQRAQTISSAIPTASTEHVEETATTNSPIPSPITQLWTTKIALKTSPSIESLFEITTLSPELFTSAIFRDSVETTTTLFTSGDDGNKITDKSDQRAHPNLHMLPVRGACGFQTIKNKIVGGDKTDIDDFPWLALLMYKYGPNITHGCGGSVINERYVLTAAHCIVGKERNLFSVRLGEYNLETEKDCVETVDGPDCAAPVQEFQIEKTIYHDRYSPRYYKWNDIALIRLDKEIVYNGFVVPICLPINGERSFAGQNLTVSGWGLTEKNTTSPIKLKVNVPLWTRTGCKEVYAIGYDFRIADHQFCAGGQSEKDSCTGDSGGPLMQRYSDGADFYQEGIVSFGPKPCGRQATPGVYVNTSLYINWILDSLEAF